MTLSLKIASVNCQGLNDNATRAATYAHLSKFNAHVYLLQETYSQPHKEETWADEWKSGQALFNSNTESNNPTAGTAILLNHPSLSFGQTKLDCK